MKYPILILILILIVPIIYSQDCNTACINSGYSSGICTDSCEDINITGGNNCALTGQAVLVIGSQAISTYENSDPFIGEEKDDPEWLWIIENIKTEASTNIRDTNDETAHTGPLLGIKNNFVATDIDSIGIKAKTIGESFCFPDDIICIKFIDLTVSDYGTYNIQKSTVDLSSFNTSWSNKDAILIFSADDTEGLKLDTDGYDIAASGANDAKTDKIWIIYNSTDSYAAVYYEDSVNAKKLAGYLNMDATNDDINIADVNYKNTQDNDIQIDLRGDFGSVDNLDLVLDILGFEGAASVDGSDDIIINLKHIADTDFTGFGNTSGAADDADQVWVSTNIGEKNVDLRSLYGIIIKDPNTNNAVDKVILEIPEDQVKAKIEITRKISDLTKIKKSPSTVLGEKIPSPILASELKFKEDNNLIFVGGPCANPPVEEFDEFPKCNNWPLKAGEAMIKYAINGQNIALLVAGTTANDTKMATEFLKSFDQYNIKGTYIKIINKEPEVINPSFAGVDFSDYPHPFIKEGKFQNMLLIIGDKAKAKDTIGATDIASSLFSVTRTSVGSINETERTDTKTNITDEIPLGNNLADSTFFSAQLSNSDIQTLIDHKTTIGGEDYNYHEAILLYSTGPSIETSLSSSDNTYKSNVYMEATAGSMRYYYIFDEIIDISTASVNSPLTINILENEISISNTQSATKFQSQSANKYFMNTGQNVTVEKVTVGLTDIASDSSIKININGTSILLREGQNKFLSDIYVKNLEAFDETGTDCCCTNLLDF